MRFALQVALLHATQYGANVIINGTFDTATTGWSTTGSPTSFTSTNGMARLVANGNAKGFLQSVTLVKDAQYIMSYRYNVAQGTGFTVSKVGMPTQGAQTGSGTKSFTFTESDGTARSLLFLTSGVGDHDFSIDDISIRRVL